MDSGERLDNRLRFRSLADTLQISEMWPIEDFIEATPPPFEMDEEIAYAILAMLTGAELQFAFPVSVDKESLGKVYELSKAEIDEYFTWLVGVGLIREY